ncbi:MAG: Holliday junction resolvase RuvX [Alphaproteobacteria bacterium CG11_big_fil_rev_8_21_14_0_20_39_49]|nr:MAG: Holliday junction resolvase RuvX [Alphaproteobacteria bacterium CG11_big_fil_rev_8_21_14_0_20_39_49]
MITVNTKEFFEYIQTSGALLGLDMGKAKIGIAICDAERIISSPMEIYQRRNISKDMGHLGKLCKDNCIVAIVIGLPLEMDGSENENCESVRNFADKLNKKTGLPILLKDERMSTAAATRALSETGMTRKKRQSLDDKVAASIILQSAIETK